MKKFFVPFLAAAMTLVGCVNTELEERVDKLESEVDAIKVELARLNSSISAFQTSIDALKLNDYVTSVVEVKENGIVIGYKLSFANSGDVIVYHGAKGDKGDQGIQGIQGDKGETGKASIVSVTLIDGVYYWTLDGKVVTDENGNKLSVTGNAPELKIEEVNGEKHLLVSYDGGNRWFDLGQAGDNFFQAVYKTEDGSAVVFELKDGQKIEIPLVPAFALACEATTASFEEETVTIKYKVNGADATDEVVVFIYYTSAGLSAEIGDKNALEGEVVIKADDITSFKNGLVVLQAINNTTGAVSGQAISLLGEVVSVDITEAVPVGYEGGNIEVKVKTNTAELTATSNAAWLTQAPAAKAEMREETVTFTAAPNYGSVRTATITLAGALGAVQNITVIQGTLPMEEIVNNSTIILGGGNGFEGIWEIVETKGIGDPTELVASQPLAAAFDGKSLTNWCAPNRIKDWPMSIVLDMKSVVAPSSFYVQQFVDQKNYHSFKFYIAEELNGENTQWTEVATGYGKETGYMTAAEYEYHNSPVHSNGASFPQKAYENTYKFACDNVAFGRYLKVEILEKDNEEVVNDPSGRNIGKIAEIYMAGMYQNPEDKPLEVKTWTGDGYWNVVAGDEWSFTSNPNDDLYNNGWYMERYSISNLVDGQWNSNYKSDPYGLVGYGQISCWAPWKLENLKDKVPISIVIEMDGTYMPYVMHIHDAQQGQGTFRNWDFYVSDSYPCEDSDWTQILSWRDRGYSWVSGGSDYSTQVDTRAAGKYLKAVITSLEGAAYTTGYSYLSEIYFEGAQLSSDRKELKTVMGNGNWKILEGEDYHGAGPAEKEAMRAAYGFGTDEEGEANLADKMASKSADWHTTHLFDGNTSTPWRTYYWTDNTYPISIVVDMGEEHTPAIFHKVETGWCSGAVVDYQFALAKSYDGENTAWEVAFDGVLGTNGWTGGLDESAKAQNEVTGRYLKITFKEWKGGNCGYADSPDGASKGKFPYQCGEIYFEEYK